MERTFRLVIPGRRCYLLVWVLKTLLELMMAVRELTLHEGFIELQHNGLDGSNVGSPYLTPKGMSTSDGDQGY